MRSVVILSARNREQEWRLWVVRQENYFAFRDRTAERLLLNHKTIYGRKRNHVNEHYPASSRAPCDTRANLSGVPGCRCNGEMASAKWLHRQGSPPGCPGWRRVQDVVHEFHHRT